MGVCRERWSENCRSRHHSLFNYTSICLLLHYSSLKHLKQSINYVFLPRVMAQISIISSLMSQNSEDPSANPTKINRPRYTRDDMLSYFSESMPIHPGIQICLAKNPDLKPVFTTHMQQPMTNQPAPVCCCF